MFNDKSHDVVITLSQVLDSEHQWCCCCCCCRVLLTDLQAALAQLQQALEQVELGLG